MVEFGVGAEFSYHRATSLRENVTLLRNRFPDFYYFTLDDLDHLEWASRDPKGFIKIAGKRAIIDEVQRLPKITVAVEYVVDNEDAILMKQTRQIEQEIVSTFLPFKPQRIILFGSFAREDEDEESDIDLIIVYSTSKRFLARLEELYLSWNIPRGIDILAYTPEEYDEMMGESDFLREAVRTGKVIHEGP
jgi:predicted nucleotidyltransferase